MCVRVLIFSVVAWTFCVDFLDPHTHTKANHSKIIQRHVPVKFSKCKIQQTLPFVFEVFKFNVSLQLKAKDFRKFSAKKYDETKPVAYSVYVFCFAAFTFVY